MISDETKTQLKAELASLRAQISEMDRLKKREAAIVGLLESYEESPNQPVLFTVEQKGNTGRYARLGLTVAVMAVLEDNKGREMTPREITQEMEKGGFKSSSKNLRTMVANTCKNKSDSPNSEVEKTQKEGAIAYRFTGRAAT